MFIGWKWTVNPLHIYCNQLSFLLIILFVWLMLQSEQFSRYLYLFYLWIFVEQVICNIFNGCMLFFCSALLISNFSAFRIYFFFVSLFTCFCFVLFPTKAFRIVETWSNIIVYGLWMNKKEMKRRSETGTKTTCIHSK